MKPWILVLAPLFLLMPRSPAPQAPAGQANTVVRATSSAEYKLVWADEFNTNGGDPSKTEFPARFEVDYVRVYQKLRE